MEFDIVIICDSLCTTWAIIQLTSYQCSLHHDVLLPFTHALTPTRWEQVVDIMLQKEESNS